MTDPDPLQKRAKALASRAAGRDAPADASKAAALDAPADPAPGVVHTELRGQVGVIVLDDERRRNALSTRMVNGVIAALDELLADGVRAVVLRAAPGMRVWSAGHDIDELPRGRRDPLNYNDALEELLRAIRTFPAPVIAMVHGSVWGGALDLVLSCDVLVAERHGDVRDDPGEPRPSVQHDRAAALPGPAWGRSGQGDVLHRGTDRRADGQGVADHQPFGGGE